VFILDRVTLTVTVDPQKRRLRAGYSRALHDLVRIVTAIADVILTSKNVAVWRIGERIVRNGVYA
jgi:hypothetical protein